jgi:small subunit ribosomal protein S4
MAQRRANQKSEYGKQLEEKQALRETYSLREKQFRRYFKVGSDPDAIIRMLEMRIDNTIYKSGFAPTIRAARQMVGHGHIQVNGKNVNIPSLQIALNDVISIHPSSVNKIIFSDLKETLKKYESPSWISLDKANFSVKIVSYPVTEDPIILGRVKPIIEFYSR